MRTRWLAVVFVWVAPLRADDRPVALPPLLTPPAPRSDTADAAERGVGRKPPVGEYDHGHYYLPETAPPKSPAPPATPLPLEETRPLGTWWLNASFDLGWASKDAPLPTLRLRVPGVRNGPVIPLEGVTPDSFRLGFDLNGGVWLDDHNRNALDAGFALLASGSETVTGVAPGVLVFFPEGAARSAAQVVAFPEPVASAFYSTFPATYSSVFTTADVNYRRSLLRGPNLRLDALVGYRFGYVADEVFVGETATYQDADGNYVERPDQPRFCVSNSFHGGQVGFAGELRAGAWSVGGVAKMAFGAVTTTVTETGIFTNPEPFTGAGFAARSGVHAGSRFAVLPTMTTTLGRHFGNDCRVFVGYSFFYLNRVARLGDVLAPSASDARYSDFWAQTVKLGLEIRY